MSHSQPLKIVCLGCGARGQTYTALAARHPDRYQVVAGADLVPERVAKVRQLASSSQQPTSDARFRAFPGADALFEAGKIGDVLIIATPDNGHFEACCRALELGYDVLLEKPIATKIGQVL